MEYFESHYKWMREMLDLKKSILIHCAAGVSRSVSFACAFIMRDKRWSY